MYSFQEEVLAFFLLWVLLHLREGTCNHLEFHCQFDDSDFNLRTANYRSNRYGEEPEGVTGNIQTNFNKIIKHYIKFLGPGVTYNGIDSYIQFYKYFRTVRDNSTTLPLSTIIQSHTVSMYPDEERVGNIITLMRRIASKEPSLAAASYLVTASPYSGKTYGDFKFDSPESYRYWHHSHVAGVIKLIEKKSGRICYVLLDPNYLKYPVAVMENGEAPPLKRYGVPRADGDWFVKYFLGPFDYAATVPVHLLWYSQDHKDYYRPRTESNFIGGDGLAYFFKRPYCTFVKQIVKPTLLNLKRVLAMMTELDYPSVVVSAENFVDNTNGTSFLAKFKLRDGIKMESIFPTEDKEEMSSKLEIMSADINLLCTALGMEKNTESCRLEWIRRIKDLKEISEDRNFLIESFYLLNRL